MRARGGSVARPESLSKNRTIAAELRPVRHPDSGLLSAADHSPAGGSASGKRSGTNPEIGIDRASSITPDFTFRRSGA